MRRVIRVSLAVLMSAGLLAAVASAQTVDEIVARNLQAKGGIDKLKAIQTIRMTGKVAAQGMEMPIMIVSKRPNLLYQEMQVQDKKIVSAFDGQKAWAINPFMGSDTPQELEGAQAEMAKEQADLDGVLVDYKAKGHTLELVGTEEIEGTKVHKLKMTRTSGRVAYLYLDASTGIDRKMTTEMEQGGKTFSLETELSNYQTVDGITLPFTIRQVMNGMPVATITVEKVEFGAPVEDSTFRMPLK
jgi:outer membrane lipoprotein-sorting protein